MVGNYDDLHRIFVDNFAGIVADDSHYLNVTPFEKFQIWIDAF